MIRNAVVFALLVAAGGAQAGNVSISSGFNPDATKLAEAKARSFGSSAFGNGNVSGFELSLDGSSPFIPAAQTVDFFRNGNPGNARYLASNPITLNYDAAGGTLTFVVEASRTFTMTTAFSPASPVNYLQMTVAGRSAGVTVGFENVVVDGQSFGDFDAAGALRDWNFTGAGLADGFTLTGDLVIGGTFTRTTTDELNRLGFKIGQTPEVVIPLPTTAGLAGLGLLAIGARRRR